jgi:hypothetical protein
MRGKALRGQHSCQDLKFAYKQGHRFGWRLNGSRVALSLGGGRLPRDLPVFPLFRVFFIEPFLIGSKGASRRGMVLESRKGSIHAIV